MSEEGEKRLRKRKRRTTVKKKHIMKQGNLEDKGREGNTREENEEQREKIN